MTRAVLVLALLASCRPPVDGTCPDADPRNLVSTGRAGVDLDHDALDDAFETALVRAHLPYLAHHPGDACPEAVILFRARPHPDDAQLVSVTASQLYALDCGLDGHPGDNEAFGMTIDPRLPPPAGLVALTAVSHQSTLCERTSTCGSCPGLAACDVVDGRAVLYSSKDKHAGAVDVGGACSFGSCLDACALPDVPASVPVVNAGEPDAHLLEVLGDVLPLDDDAWSDDLRAYRVWDGAEFGGAGVVADDFADDAFLTPACTCSAAE